MLAISRKEVALPTPRRIPKPLQVEGLPTIHPNAAGMDIGADEIVVAVPLAATIESDRATDPVPL